MTCTPEKLAELKGEFVHKGLTGVFTFDELHEPYVAGKPMQAHSRDGEWVAELMNGATLSALRGLGFEGAR